MSTPPPRDPTDGPEAPPPLVDFAELPGRVGRVLIPVIGLCLAGAVIDGAFRGLTFALLARWGGIAVVLAVLAMAVVTGLHALGGAGRAGELGERLASPDVGLSPRKLAEEQPADQIAPEET